VSAPEPTYMIPDEVKNTLRYKSRKSVYRLAEDPTCPVLRIGGTLRFPRERFLAWLREHEQGRGRPRVERRLPPSDPQPVHPQGDPA
jgi:Helix-turn-helix domain